MKTYKMILTGIDGVVLAVANTHLGLLREYNRYLLDINFQKVKQEDLDNELNISVCYENGIFDAMGNDLN